MTLICSMLHPSKEYCFDNFFGWCKDQTHEGCDYFIQVNTGKYGSPGAVRDMREKARKMALAEERDLFFLDCDVLPPLDAITSLYSVQANMVTGIYCMRGESKPMVWKDDTGRKDFIKSELSSDIAGAGMGLCLIRNSVLQVVGWDYTEVDDDWPYWKKAKEIGFICKSLNTLSGKHYSSKDEYFEISDIAEKKEPMYQYDIKSPSGIRINGVLYKGRVALPEDLMGTIRELDEGAREHQNESRRTI